MNAATLGSAALWAAIATGMLTLAPGLGRRLRRASLALSAGFALLSVSILAIALVAGDFSLAYVAETTSRATPWAYRLSALWGGMDGSMLFYAALTLAAGYLGVKGAGAGSMAIGAVALFGTGYLLIAVLAANPFDTLGIPAVDGSGLLAILQHPAMIYHPPILYLGLTTLVVPFVITIDTLKRGEPDRAWIRVSRRWLIASWALLTFGMLAGANWAYIELGWGGFWAWDPVENTALMPWLAATVFIHTSRIQERDGRLVRWNVLFALLPFALTIVGVYLTRSGVTGSIHSFAEDPLIGRALLAAAVLVLALAGLVSIGSSRGVRWDRIDISRDSWLAACGGLIAAALVFVTIGTAYPAYAQVFFDRAVSVDSTFFVVTLLPIALLVGTLTAFALDTSWTGSMPRRTDLLFWVSTASLVGIGAYVVVDVIAIAPIVLLAGASASVLLLARKLLAAAPKGRAVGAHIAHLGLAMILVGAGGSALGGEYRGVMAPGESIEVSGQSVALLAVETGAGDRFLFVRGTFEIDGQHTLTPEIRAYEEQGAPVAEPDIRSTPLSDVVVAISRLSPDAETVRVSVFVRPMVWWVWGGALLMALAGLIALYAKDGGASRRRRGARSEQLREGTTTDKSSR